jgi:hypothetical protein
MKKLGTLVPKNEVTKESKDKLDLNMSKKFHNHNIELLKQLTENLYNFKNDLPYHLLAFSAENYYKEFYESQLELIKKNLTNKK